MSHGWQAARLHGLPHSLLIKDSSFSYIYLNISFSLYIGISCLSQYLIYNALQCHKNGRQPGYMVSHILFSSETHLSQSHIFISIYLDISRLSWYLICNALQCHKDGRLPGCMVSRILCSSETHLSQFQLERRNLWPILTSAGKSSSSSRPASQWSETCGRKCSLPEENAVG